MKKKLLCLVLAVVCLFGVAVIPAAYAEDDETTVKKLESELDIIKKKQAETKKTLQNLKNKQYSQNVILAVGNLELRRKFGRRQKLSAILGRYSR